MTNRRTLDLMNSELTSVLEPRGISLSRRVSCFGKAQWIRGQRHERERSMAGYRARANAARK
jgi:hypothetical protein